MSDLLDVLRDHRTTASTDHNRKEQSAYAVTALYLAGTSTWLLASSFWATGRPATFIVSLLATLAAFALTFSFVGWQLRNRSAAVLRESACINVMTMLLARDDATGTPEERKPARWKGEDRWPKILVAEMHRIEEEVGERTSLAELLTYGAIVSWTVLVIVRIVIAWRSVA